jgi:glycosyltransferase involved in cell wall biosynthesis
MMVKMVPTFTKEDLVIIIPAHNEEASLPTILGSIKSSISEKIIVIDNASVDETGKIAKKAGVQVLYEERLGYGNACLKGIEYLESIEKKPSIICFFDGDGQSKVTDVLNVANPVLQGKVKYCQGSRMVFPSSKNSLDPLARVANRFFAFILSLTYRQTIKDLGPLRIITWDVLKQLDMKSHTFGWTMEMSAKLLKTGINHIEIPVHYARRTTGKSKISGNFWSAFKAAWIMIITYCWVLLIWRPSHE